MDKTRTTTYVHGDHLLLGVIAFCAVAAVGIGSQYARVDAALWVGVPLLAAAAIVWLLARGSLFCHMGLTTIAMAMIALHIHVGMGSNLYHFGVFVLLALLLVYRDWRIILLAATIGAVHHVLFNELQAAGWGVSCFTEPSRVQVVLHAIYVVVQTAMEIWIARMLRHESDQAADVLGVVRRIAAQDGRVNLDMQSAGVSTPLGAALVQALEQMHDAVGQVEAASLQIHAGAQEIAAGNADLSSRTEEQAASLEQTGAAIEGLVETVKQNSGRAQQASELAGAASGVAARGGDVMRGVVATMGGISESSKKIGDIIGVIDGIAFQTNILALNAAVEAARAGEQGRGFAVVAAEVRNLAQRSAAAAKETKQLIGASVDRVQGGSKLLEDAGRTMDEILGAVKGMSGIITEIAAASRDQLTSIGQVSQSMSQIDGMSQRNAALVEETAAAAQSMSGQAEHLMEAVARFTLGGARPQAALAVIEAGHGNLRLRGA